MHPMAQGAAILKRINGPEDGYRSVRMSQAGASGPGRVGALGYVDAAP